MSDWSCFLIAVLLGTLGGAVAGYVISAAPDAETVGEIPEIMAEIDRRIEMRRLRVDESRQALDRLAPRTDELLFDRWQKRAHIRLPVKDPEIGSRTTDPVNKAFVFHMLRLDDRLVAKLLQERRAHARVHAQYDTLLAVYRERIDVMEQQIARARSASARSKRRLMVTTAAVAAAVTLLLAGN